MAKTAAIGFAPNTPLFARLLAAIDRALMASARISLRNGDYVGSFGFDARVAAQRSLSISSSGTGSGLSHLIVRADSIASNKSTTTPV